VKHNRVLVHGDKRYTYDGLGRLTDKVVGKHTHLSLQWNVENQLVEATTTRNGLRQTVRFGYDALGRRVRKSGSFGSVYFVWSGMRLLQEQQGAKLTTHVYEDQASYVPLARIEQMHLAQLKDVGLDHDYAQNPQFFKPRIYHVHANTAGAPEELTDDHGYVVWQARYQTWGNVALQADTGPQTNVWAMPAFKPESQALRMQGQYADTETGLHYNLFRYYDPEVGRFISQDPIGLNGGINLYQYAPNPISWIDPWGLCRRGNASTKSHMDGVRNQMDMDNPGITHLRGGRDATYGKELPETFLKPLNPGRKGGSYADMTFKDAQGRTVYVQTVDKGSVNGMSQREWDNAVRITQQAASAIVITVPKGTVLQSTELKPSSLVSH
jgi:RHS repeat-associated protein